MASVPKNRPIRNFGDNLKLNPISLVSPAARVKPSLGRALAMAPKSITRGFW